MLAGQPGSLVGLWLQVVMSKRAHLWLTPNTLVGKIKPKKLAIRVALLLSPSLALEQRQAKQERHDFLLESALATASLPCLVARSLTAPGRIRSLAAVSTSRAVNDALSLDCTECFLGQALHQVIQSV